jgi:hypothetical protein
MYLEEMVRYYKAKMAELKVASKAVHFSAHTQKLSAR